MNALQRSVWLLPLGFALACGGGDVAPVPVVAPPPPVVVAPPPVEVPSVPAATEGTTTTTTVTTSTTSTTVKAATGSSCCKIGSDWGEQWGLGVTQSSCDGEWVTGKECDKVCCSTNDETIGWRSRGSCRSFGMWSSKIVDAGQCKGLGLEDSKVIGNPGGGEPANVVEEEDELILEDLDAPPPPVTKPRGSGVTKSRPK